MYLVFEGVRNMEKLLSAVLPLTDADISCAPNVLGVRLEKEADAQPFFDDPAIQEMDDMPGGFWSMSIENDDYYLDRCEESCIHSRGFRKKKH